MAKKKGVRRAAARAAPKHRGRAGCVVLRTASEEFEIPCGKELQRAAMEWNYVVRTRLRWRADEESRDDLSSRSRRQLHALQLNDDQLARLARESLVEVSCRYESEGDDWEGRVMPWEHLLNAGTRDLRGESWMCVVRHLDRGRQPKTARPLKARLSVVASAPGKLGQRYSFSRQNQLPALRAAGVTLADRNVQLLQNPVFAELQTALAAHRPSLIHVAGVNNYEAADMLKPQSEETRGDGIVFLDHNRQPEECNAGALANTFGSTGAELVVFNVHRSAARIAALTVAEGAHAAVGFQDTIDGTAAELFLSDFYYAWKRHQRDRHVSFLVALQLLRGYEVPLGGSGIVLWSSESVFEKHDETLMQTAVNKANQILEERRKILRPADIPSSEVPHATQAVTPDIAPAERVNYSLLHNRRPIFRQFCLVKNVEEQVKDVRVRVNLQTAAGHARCQMSCNLTQPLTDVASKISLPLTWMKDGGFAENVRTNLHVQVQWGSHTLSETSHVVTLIPANEWEDSDEHRQYLPSFVYPRDPGVHRVIRWAQHALVGMADSLRAGFDGYQSVDWNNQVDPTEGVDRQARAIWSALVQDARLTYINPPPSYNIQSQRLRSPSEVLDQGSGTCIDLALLLASCFEYVDIFPVLFLIRGHAFAGYWRSQEAHADFTSVSMPTASVASEQNLDVQQSKPWLLAGESAHSEVMQYLQRGDLVPLEAVWLTRGEGFWEAVEAGWENLRNADEFHAMIDIRRARAPDCDVTPLPIRGART